MFNKKSEAEPKIMSGNRSTPSATFSMLSADLSVKGNINATADLHIDGRVEGDITCASLVQGEASQVIGAIVARSARLSGKVDGSISCGELVILKSARINGDVSYDSLTIEQGAIIDGRLSPRGPEAIASAPEETPVMFSNATE